jgi:hypothetical protein
MAKDVHRLIATEVEQGLFEVLVGQLIASEKEVRYTTLKVPARM